MWVNKSLLQHRDDEYPLQQRDVSSLMLIHQAGHVSLSAGFIVLLSSQMSPADFNPPPASSGQRAISLSAPMSTLSDAIESSKCNQQRVSLDAPLYFILMLCFNC